jgi:translation initiation factor 4G
MSQDLVIRNAGPKDSPFLAWLMLVSGRGHVQRGVWEVILQLPEEDCLEFFRLLTVTESIHLYHYSCYLLAELEGKPVAGLGGHDPAVLGYHSITNALPEVLPKAKKNPLWEIVAGAPTPKIVDCIPPALEGVWVIDSVATLPDFRRRGIVDRLLVDMIERGRSRGFKRSQICLFMGNTPAQRAYEKQGFKVTDEYPDPYFEKEIGAPGMARMIRML